MHALTNVNSKKFTPKNEACDSCGDLFSDIQKHQNEIKLPSIIARVLTQYGETDYNALSVNNHLNERARKVRPLSENGYLPEEVLQDFKRNRIQRITYLILETNNFATPAEITFDHKELNPTNLQKQLKPLEEITQLTNACMNENHPDRFLNQSALASKAQTENKPEVLNFWLDRMYESFFSLLSNYIDISKKLANQAAPIITFLTKIKNNSKAETMALILTFKWDKKLMDRLSQLSEDQECSLLAKLALAGIYLHQKDYKNASSCFTEVLKNDPTNCDSLYSLGIINFETNNFKNAVSFFTQAFENKADIYKPRAALYLADLYFRGGYNFEKNRDKAKEYYVYAIDRNLTKLNTRSTCFTLLNSAEINRYAKAFTLGEEVKKTISYAKKLYKCTLEKEPYNTEALIALGDICVKEKNLAEAKNLYAQAIEVQPNDIELIKKALQLDPSNRKLKEQLIEAYKAEIESNSKVNKPKKLIFSANVRVMVEIVSLYSELREIENETVWVTKAVDYALESKNVDVITTLADTIKYEDIEQAKKLYTTAVELDPSNIEFIKSVIEFDKDNEQVQSKLIDAYREKINSCKSTDEAAVQEITQLMFELALLYGSLKRETEKQEWIDKALKSADFLKTVKSLIEIGKWLWNLVEVTERAPVLSLYTKALEITPNDSSIIREIIEKGLSASAVQWRLKLIDIYHKDFKNAQNTTHAPQDSIFQDAINFDAANRLDILMNIIHQQSQLRYGSPGDIDIKEHKEKIKICLDQAFKIAFDSDDIIIMQKYAELLSKSVTYFSSQSNKQACDLLEKILKIDENNISALKELAALYKIGGNGIEENLPYASKLYEKLVTLDPTTKEHLIHGLELDPSKEAYRLQLIKLYELDLENGLPGSLVDSDDSEEDENVSIEFRIDVMLKIAAQYALLYNETERNIWCDKVIATALHTQDVKHILKVANKLSSQHEWAARTLLQNSLEFDDKTFSIHYRLLHLLDTNDGDRKEATELRLRLINLHKESYTTNLTDPCDDLKKLTTLYFELGTEYKNEYSTWVEKLIDAYVQQKSNHEMAFLAQDFRRGRIYGRNLDAAKRLCEEALKINKTNFNIRILLAEILSESKEDVEKNRERAKALYQEAYSATTGDWNWSSVISRQKNKEVRLFIAQLIHKKHIEYLNDELRTDKENTTVLINIARLYQQMGETETATKWISKACKIALDSKNVDKIIMTVEAIREKLENGSKFALELLEYALTLDKDNVDALALLADILSEENQDVKVDIQRAEEVRLRLIAYYREELLTKPDSLNEIESITQQYSKLLAYEIEFHEWLNKLLETAIKTKDKSIIRLHANRLKPYSFIGAKKLFEALLELDKTDERALLAIAEMYAIGDKGVEKDLERANGYFQKAKRLNRSIETPEWAL